MARRRGVDPSVRLDALGLAHLMIEVHGRSARYLRRTSDVATRDSLRGRGNNARAVNDLLQPFLRGTLNR